MVLSEVGGSLLGCCAGFGLGFGARVARSLRPNAVRATCSYACSAIALNHNPIRTSFVA